MNLLKGHFLGSDLFSWFVFSCPGKGENENRFIMQKAKGDDSY